MADAELAHMRERRLDERTAFLLILAVALAGWLVSPPVALAFVAAALALVAMDWRVSSPALLSGFVAIVLLVPADVRVALPLPMDMTSDRLFLLFLLAATAFGLIELPADDAVSPASRRTEAALKLVLAVALLSFAVNGSGSSRAGFFMQDAKALLTLATVSATYFLTFRIAHRPEIVLRVCRVIVVAGGLAAASAVVERFTLSNAIKTTLLRFPLLELTRPPEDLLRGSDLRVAGTGEHPIAFGGVMIMLLPVALYLTLTAEGRKRYAWGSMSLLIAAAMLFTVSRSTVLAALVTLPLLLVLWPEWRRKLAWAGVGAVFAAHMLVPGLLGTFRSTLQPSWVLQQESDENSSARFTDYPKVAEMVPKHPLVGIGYNAFDPRRYFFLDNQVLKFLLELGFLGIAALGVFVGRVVAPLVRATRAGPRGETRLEGALLCSVLAFLLLSVFFDTFGFVQVTYLFFIIAALGVRTAEARLAGEAAA